jgi:hypothetical protein
MKEPLPQRAVKEVVPADIWIERLSQLLKVTAMMEPDERSAAFAFLKSKFREQWPSDGY